MAINTLVVDENISHTEEVVQSLSSSSSIDVKLVSSINEANKFIDTNDVIVVDMLLSGRDAFNLISNIRSKYVNKIIIATSEFISADMMREISNFKVNYFLKKPFNAVELSSVIEGLYFQYKLANKPITNDEVKVEITNLLHNLGIPSHIKGYNYIRDGIEKIFYDTSLVGAITKELYPSIASTYSTTSSRVERAIRHAIEISWVRGDYDLMDEIFGNSIDFDRSRPTNAEFIVTLADRLRLKTHE